MSNPAELFAGMGAPRMDAAEIQTKIAKAVQQKELGNQCVASNDLSKALYHYHYCMWWWWQFVRTLLFSDGWLQR